VTLGATLVASMLVTLSRPSTWALGLAGFLVRGGIVLVIAPIIVLPTAVGLANIVAPLLEDVAFGRRVPELVVLVAWVFAALVAWVVGGGLLAAAVEADLTRRVAEDDELTAAGHVPSTRSVMTRQAGWILGARLLSYLPVVIALAWGSNRVVEVAYRELTVPSDTDVALVFRVAAGAPVAIAAILLAWFIGEIVGAMAARRIVLLGEQTARALWGAVGWLVRHPLRCLVLGLLPLLQLALVLTGVGLAGSATWDTLRGALAFGDQPVAAAVLLVVFVGLFSAGLVLVGVTSAWRSAAWTVDLAGTFGGVSGSPLGGYGMADPSSTLVDLGPSRPDVDQR
jgi:hypothetical protein